MSSVGGVPGITLIERSFVCSTGGGFETERWSVRVNDGWLPIPALFRRGDVGGIKVEVLDEDDPAGVAGRERWTERAPQVWFKRSTRIMAPKGTRFWRRTWRPLIDPSRLEYPLPQRVFDDYFELRGEERLVSERVLAQRAAEREARRSSKPLTRDETRGYASLLLARLEGAEGTANRTGPGALVEADAAASPLAPDVSRRRRVPVRTLALPVEPALVPSVRPAIR